MFTTTPINRCAMPPVPVLPGSIKHYAHQHNQPLALAWLQVQAVILFDRSSSMDERDAPGKLTRFELAVSELAKLQAQCPGRVAIVQFNDECSFQPGGVPDKPAGTTDLAGALELVKRKQMDSPGMRIIVISDGEPDDEAAALTLAKKFANRIDVVYCGPADKPDGRDFLRRLSAASGGQLVTADCATGLMAATIKLLAVGA